MSEIEHPSDRIVELRTALLAGRGPGASAQEIAEHTRNRPLLGAVPAPVERALVARQASHLRAGEPISTHRARAQARRGRRRAALFGAAAALIMRAAVGRLVRSRRRPHRWPVR